MFKRATLRQHATAEGVEVPRKKRQAKSAVHLGSDGKSEANFYAVMQIESEGENPTCFITADPGLVSCKLGELEVALTPVSPHPVTVKAGDRTYQISDLELVCVSSDGQAVRLVEKRAGEFSVDPI